MVPSGSLPSDLTTARTRDEHDEGYYFAGPMPLNAKGRKMEPEAGLVELITN